MDIRYVHTNIIARDWRRLASFYQDVFGCVIVPPKRNQSGEWLERGTGLEGASLQGVHLRLPGHGDNGPTLEIYQYGDVLERPATVPNRQGYGHISFEVDDVEAVREAVVQNGGTERGEITTHEVAGKSTLTFVYVNDPEGNILEIQHWS